MRCPNCKHTLIKGTKKYLCEECGAQFNFAEVEKFAITDEQISIIHNFPYMIALPFRDMLLETHPTSKIKLLIDVFTNVLKYLALIVETDYLQSTLCDFDINEALRKLDRPLVSYWKLFLDVALKKLIQHNVQLTIPEIMPFYAEIQTRVKMQDRIQVPKGFYDDEGIYVEKSDCRLSPIEALISYRNSFAHGFNPSHEQANSDFAFYYPVLQSILKRMQWCQRYVMHVVVGNKYLELRGYDPKPIPINAGLLDSIHPADLPRYSVLLKSDGGLLPLLPFFISPTMIIRAPDENIALFVYEHRTEKRVLYVSPNGAKAESAYLTETWDSLIRQKMTLFPHFTPNPSKKTEIAERSATITKRVESVLLSERRMSFDAIIRRSEPFTRVMGFPESQSKLLMIWAEVGAGKTTFLLELSRVWQQSDFSTLFILAKDQVEPNIELIIANQLGLDPNWSTKDDLVSCLPSPWIVILDGVNESQRGHDLFQNTIEFSQRLSKHRNLHVKFVLTWRCNSPEELPNLSQLPSKWIFVPATQGRASAGKPYLHLPHFNEVELEAAWDKFTMSLNQRPRATPTISPARIPSLHAAIGNPLILRMFSELLESSMAERPMKGNDVLELYVRNLSAENETVISFLLRIVEIYKENRFSDISLDDLYNDPQCGESVRNTQVNSPYYKLIRARVLCEIRLGSAIFVRFVSPLVQDYVLSLTITESDLASNLSSYLNSTTTNSLGNAWSLAISRSWHRGNAKPIQTLVLSVNESTEDIIAKILLNIVTEDQNANNLQRLLEIIFDSASDKAFKLFGKVLHRLNNSNYANLVADIAIAAHLKRYPLDTLDSYPVYSEFIECKSQRISLELRQFWFTLMLNAITENEKPAAATFPEQCKMLSWQSIKLGDRKAVSICLETGEAAMVRFYGQSSIELAGYVAFSGITYAMAGEAAKAEDQAKKCATILKEIKGTGDSKEYLNVLNDLGLLEDDLKNHSLAKTYLQEVLIGTEAKYGKKSLEYVNACRAMGWHYFLLNPKDSLPMFQEAESVAKALDDYPWTSFIEIQSGIARASSGIGEHSTAVEIHQSILKQLKAQLGSQHPDLSTIFTDLALAYSELGEYGKAIDSCNQALDVLAGAYGPSNPTSLDALELLEDLYRKQNDDSNARTTSNLITKIKTTRPAAW